MSPHAMVQDFSPVSLDELSGTAALMRRVDRKYALRCDEAAAVLDAIPAGTRALTIDGQQEFDYLSTYFDTHSWDAYLLDARSRPEGFKVRIRHYDATHEAFLEVETTEGGQTDKRRIPHDPRNLMAVRPEQHGFLSECLASVRVRTIRPAWLLPTLQTSYRRTTLLTADSGARVTIDNNLRWCAMGVGTADAADLVVIETKSHGAASDVDRILWSRGHRPERISKYVTGLAALRPELPTNRWHRTLQTHCT